MILIGNIQYDDFARKENDEIEEMAHGQIIEHDAKREFAEKGLLAKGQIVFIYDSTISAGVLGFIQGMIRCPDKIAFTVAKRGIC